VNRGDVLYAIDPRWLKLAVVSAQADVESKRHEMLMRQDAAHRRTLIKNAISSEDLQQTGSAANVAAANYHGALAALDLAELNLAHATVRAPVSGYVTHLRLRPGDYATAGETKVAIVDAHSFWVVGYFEETKLRHIRVGDAAQVVLMGYEPVITGTWRASGVGSGTATTKRAGWGCPTSNPPLAGCGWRSACRCAFISTGCRRALSWWRGCRRAWRWGENLGIVSLKHICETYRF
jgi:multidrug resistance efflux pump